MKKYLAFVFPVMFLASACSLLQDPDGSGNDPSVVTVEVEATLDINVPDKDGELDDMLPLIDSKYTRRFIIDIIQPDGTLVERAEEYLTIIDGKTSYNVSHRFRLNARQYEVLVWSDYIEINDTATVAFFDISSLTPVLPDGNYKGNDEHNDCFRGWIDLDLRQYRNEASPMVYVEVPLTRPMARYELISTDLGAFRNRIASGQISGSEFTVRVRYANYHPTGYNVQQDVPKNYLSYMYYNKKIPAAALTGTDASLSIGFDWCIVEPGVDNVSIPVEIETFNANQQHVSRVVTTLSLKQGHNTVISGRFLTGSDEGGVGVDTDYDGTVNVDLGIL